MPSKTPTASGISRLLKNAGFKRSERQIGGFGDGYHVTKELIAYEQRVAVRHRFWSMRGGDSGPHLAKYAEAITAAGYEVTVEKYRLIVTAKAED